MTEQIAIVGMGGIFPRCRNLDEFWQLLLAKGTTVSDIPEDRAEIDLGKLDVVSTRACLISDELLAEVSADLQLAEGYDPLLRLTVAAGQQALADTRSYPSAIDQRRTAIILGHVLLPTEFSSRLTADFYFPQRLQRKKVLPINRFISDLPAKILAKYFFDNLPQESFCIDAACASTLYSLKLARDALLERRADTVVCGGVLRTDAIYTQVGFSQLKALSARACCAPFDVNADGLVVGEGAGIFVVKRLTDALADNDRIHGILSAVGVATDVGGNILAPDSNGQLQAMTDAYRQTLLTFADIDLVECHATGAPLGDQIELNSLRQLARDNNRRCLLSAVKGNVGHLLAAAGAASLAKVLLAMRHQKIPAIANFTNCRQQLDDSPLKIVEETHDWPNQTKRAAINGFGFGGINAHAIIEQQAGQTISTKVASNSDSIAVIAVATDNLPKEKSDYRLPPKLVAEMLPRQQLMLDLAIRVVTETIAKTGVYIGLGLDCRIGNFYLRWLGLDNQQPPLSYERTLGSLASVVVSRIARRFSCAGPSFTVSDGTMSGVQALKIASQALRRADIDRAIVGAVDFASHPLNVYADSDRKQQEDGGFILVLKRLTDAQDNGDKILYAFNDLPNMASETGVHYGYAQGLSRIVDETLSKPSTNYSFNYQQCLTFARGNISEVLGEQFAEIDNYAVRVRLPDEPLMLCHRILHCQAEPLSMQGGSIQTAHDINADSWYLDHQRIPVAIAVEAGQADLFLCSLLGIDFHNCGQAVYRLLDAQITFSQPLPTAGTTIIYDINIDKFFRHGNNWFFNFRFVATIDGQEFLRMENGCAGFFSATQLAMGRGLFRGKPKTVDARDRLPLYTSMVDESYSSQQLDCLRRGDFVGCFGGNFANLSLIDPCRLADGRLRLIDRITLQPTAGDYRLGLVSGELDIKADAWFLTCHFVDDQVMPGTLMYECCLQTLRIFLWRKGLVCEANDYCCQPIVGVKTTLKCRGQVTAANNVLRCDVHIKQLDTEPSICCLADAYLYIDDKLSVTFSDVALQYRGLNEGYFRNLWKVTDKKAVVYSDQQILAFAYGKPSDCFGDRYRVFDEERRVARLPSPPYKFLNRITAVNPSEWQFANGASCEAQYDIETDGWYFADDGIMPFSILLEVGLQPCGWLAAYVGCALQSEIDLSFRNLDGQGQQLQVVRDDSGTLTTQVQLTKLVKLSTTILCNFEMEISSLSGVVYRATTGFGFFTIEALAGASGIGGRRLASMSSQRPYPQGIVPRQLQMIDDLELLEVNGGKHQLGLVRGSKKVVEDEWFFKAHFYQDPVVPGSLGIESFLQLLRLLVWEKFTKDTIVLAPDSTHSWCYRGQVVPSNSLMTTMVEIKKITDNRIIADGLFAVDGLVIYEMRGFAVLLTA